MPNKAVLLALSILALSARIALPQDRASETDRIRAAIAAINDALTRSDAAAFARLFPPDGDLRFGDDLVAEGRAAIENALKKPRIWSEVTAPHIEDESVRFLSADSAVVDATQTRYGSVILKQSVPVTLLFKRDGREWRIVSFRVLCPPALYNKFAKNCCCAL